METEISFIFQQGPFVLKSQIYTDFKGFKVSEGFRGFKVSKGFKGFNVPMRFNVVNDYIISI